MRFLRKQTALLLSVLLCLCAFAPGIMAETKFFLREDFNNKDNWQPFYFPQKSKKHTLYTIVRDSNGNSYLKASSNSSASAIIYKKEFHVYEHSRIKWRWKIENIYEKSNPNTKEGDDYPIRIYVLFKYDPEKAGFFEKLKYSAAKAIYGQYPPKSTLSYVWASTPVKDRFFPNPFSNKAMMVVLESGDSRLGEWVTEEVDILHDYKSAFGDNPPENARIAIMNDSDNTGEEAVSYIDFIEVL